MMAFEALALLLLTIKKMPKPRTPAKKPSSAKKQKLTKSSSASKKGQKTRTWNENGTDKSKLFNLFRTGQADPRRFDPKYITSIWEKNPFVREVYPLNKKAEFYTTYRRHGLSFSEEEDKAGARRGKINCISITSFSK